jgi:uncharacterized protein (DUF2344 family)
LCSAAGFTSDCEVLDAWLERELTIAVVQQALDPSLPPGIRIQHIEAVEQHLPALQTQVQSAEYVITLLEYPPDLSERLDRLENATSLPRLRRNNLMIFAH